MPGRLHAPLLHRVTGRYEVFPHFTRWTVRDHADIDATNPPLFDHRWQADARCAQLNAAADRRRQPTPTLFDKEPTVTQPSIWDLDDGDFRRNDKGQPLILPVGGGDPIAYRRATSYISVAEDDYGIHQWKRHLTVDAALEWDAVDRNVWKIADWHGKSALAQMAFVAAGGEVKANNGTRMHALTDLIDSGETGYVPDGVSPEEEDDLRAYRNAVAPLTLIHAEVKTVNDPLQVAGTPDRVWEYQGRRYIGDLKTGKIDARKCAMQTALYAHSRLYDVATGVRTDLDVDLERALIIHLPYGEAKARVLWVDIAAGWEGVQLCAQIHAWRKRTGLTRTFKAPAVDDLILAAESRDDLLALRARYRPDGLWTAEHDAAAKARLDTLTGPLAA